MKTQLKPLHKTVASLMLATLIGTSVGSAFAQSAQQAAGTQPVLANNIVANTGTTATATTSTAGTQAVGSTSTTANAELNQAEATGENNCEINDAIIQAQKNDMAKNQAQAENTSPEVLEQAVKKHPAAKQCLSGAMDIIDLSGIIPTVGSPTIGALKQALMKAVETAYQRQKEYLVNRVCAVADAALVSALSGVQEDLNKLREIGTIIEDPTAIATGWANSQIGQLEMESQKMINEQVKSLQGNLDKANQSVAGALDFLDNEQMAKANEMAAGYAAQGESDPEAEKLFKEQQNSLQTRALEAEKALADKMAAAAKLASELQAKVLAEERTKGYVDGAQSQMGIHNTYDPRRYQNSQQGHYQNEASQTQKLLDEDAARRKAEIDAQLKAEAEKAAAAKAAQQAAQAQAQAQSQTAANNAAPNSGVAGTTTIR